MFQKRSQKQIWGPKTGVPKQKGGPKRGHGRKKGVQNMVAETKMDLKYGHGNKNGSQIWSQKQNEVSNMVTEIYHSWQVSSFFMIFP